MFLPTYSRGAVASITVYASVSPGAGLESCRNMIFAAIHNPTASFNRVPALRLFNTGQILHSAPWFSLCVYMDGLEMTALSPEIYSSFTPERSIAGIAFMGQSSNECRGPRGELACDAVSSQEKLHEPSYR
ncbi:hypothetical protein E4U43_000729, partial [Claviceps pusilla]